MRQKESGILSSKLSRRRCEQPETSRENSSRDITASRREFDEVYMMSSAHSKDNGSPTSVAHNLDDDQTVVVRRDDLVVIDNVVLGTLCEDVQIASRRNAGIRQDGWS